MLILLLTVLVVSYLGISGYALKINYDNKRDGFEGVPWLDCINPKKWYSVLYGTILYIIIPPHVFEQYVLRFYAEDCQVCIKAGKCVGGSSCGADCSCGCDTLKKMYSPFEKDSGNIKGVGRSWTKIIRDKKKYEAVRRNSPVSINIEFKNNKN